MWLDRSPGKVDSLDPTTSDVTVFADPGWTAGPDAAPRHARVQPIDFRRPTKFPRDLIRRLEHAHESFCRTASMGMSAELRTDVEIVVSRTEQLPYGTAMTESNQDSLIAVLEVKPLETEMALLVEMPFALRLVDRLLGGAGKAQDAQPGTPLTDLEIAIVRRAMSAICKPLSATWLDLAEVEFEIASMQTSPMGLQLVSPSEPVLMLILEVRLDGIVTPLTLCIPHRSVEPVIDRLEHRYQGTRQKDDASAGKVHAAMSGVDVELRAELGAVDMKVEDVVGLEVGDVVYLRRPAEKGVVLYAGDVATYVGQAGRDSHNRAVQVSGRWSKGR
jgi:flagellar motor switch protein FliM